MSIQKKKKRTSKEKAICGKLSFFKHFVEYLLKIKNIFSFFRFLWFFYSMWKKNRATLIHLFLFDFLFWSIYSFPHEIFDVLGLQYWSVKFGFWNFISQKICNIFKIIKRSFLFVFREKSLYLLFFLFLLLIFCEKR